MPKKDKVKSNFKNKWSKTMEESRTPKNPLSTINFSSLLKSEEKKVEKEKDSIKKIQKDYEKILKKKIQREHRAFKVTYENHPDLFYIAFASNRAQAIYRSARYFQSIFNPFFSTNADYSREMRDSRALRIKELDEYGLKGEIVPIPALLKATGIPLPCSVCGKGKFEYSDYIDGKCFIIEGEGNLNPYTKGYILCYDCYQKYLDKDS